MPLLGWSDLERLVARGVSIGAHTRTHSSLTASGTYRIEGDATRVAEMTIAGEGSASFVSAFGRSFGTASAKVTYRQQRLEGEVEARLPDARVACKSGRARADKQYGPRPPAR